MSDCQHMQFTADVVVDRVTDDAGRPRNFVAEVTIRCQDCGEPFHFVGVEAGLSFHRPTVGVGATTLHAPIASGMAPLPARMHFEVPARPEDAS